ncbi:MAG: FKBP-type peptidyl-prolyl cis-trans isomerase [Pseudomonadota bacterium]|nr:FKBP-type peptidyl-prolyl cis-trans isomerase [Pseudomonadota bacterium]
MKHNYRLVPAALKLCLLAATLPAAHAQTPGPAAPAPSALAATAPAEASSEQTSYLFGLTFGEQMHGVGITNQIDTEAVARGVKDGLQGKKSTRADQQQIQGFVQKVMAEALAHNKAAAQEFLARNGREKGVKTTADGLQYKVLVPGDAKAAAIAPTDEVTVNYRGKLLDGGEFDSSYARGMPATFKVNGVIKGWQEALVLMKPGAKWQLFVPPELAYDTNPRPGIPAGSLLTFDVELISVKSSEPAAVPPAPHKAPPSP